MITARRFLEAAYKRGFDLYTGVPCSYLAPLTNCILSERRSWYISASCEGEAVAIAVGAWLAGRGAVVFCQNDGFGNAINPLTSLTIPFRIPILVLITWRGRPGEHDEPQHVVMGAILYELAKLVGLPPRCLPATHDGLDQALDEATEAMARFSIPFALIVPREGFGPDTIDPVDTRAAHATSLQAARCDLRSGLFAPARQEVLGSFLKNTPADVAVVATTGMCSRELFALDDREQHFYQVGSMGCASGIALGVALNTGRRVVVLDGDGAALMKLGTFATIGAYGPTNLCHVLLDNNSHASTGGQPTVSGSVDFAGIAIACGYRQVYACDDVDGFEMALLSALRNPGPSMVHVKIARRSASKVGRPAIAPHENALRFKEFVCRSVDAKVDVWPMKGSA